MGLEVMAPSARKVEPTSTAPVLPGRTVPVAVKLPRPPPKDCWKMVALLCAKAPEAISQQPAASKARAVWWVVVMVDSSLDRGKAAGPPQWQRGSRRRSEYQEEAIIP